jgi:site-specific DNA recombinase
LKNVRDVQKELARLNLRTKSYSVQRGRAVGNLSFARGHIYRILSNPIYRGEISHKGVNHPGQHPGLISDKTWAAVQAQLAANKHANRSRSNAGSTSLLAGIIFDANNNRLVSSHATNNGKRYRYYITSDGTGRSVPASNTAKVRVSAAQIDDLVLSTLSGFLNDKQKIVNFLRKHRSRAADVESALEVASHLADVLVSDSPGRKPVLVADLLSRVTIAKTSLKISVRPTQLRAVLSNRAAPSGGGESEPDILLEAQFSSSTGAQRTTRLLIEDGGGRPSEPDPVVVKAVARAHWWFEQLVSGKS